MLSQTSMQLEDTFWSKKPHDHDRLECSVEGTMGDVTSHTWTYVCILTLKSQHIVVVGLRMVPVGVRTLGLLWTVCRLFAIRTTFGWLQTTDTHCFKPSAKCLRWEIAPQTLRLWFPARKTVAPSGYERIAASVVWFLKVVLKNEGKMECQDAG